VPAAAKDLRLMAEENSERYGYTPASMKVIQDVCLKYACDCKPPQPIEKSTAGASLLAQVIVAKWADHQPLHRQEKMFARHGIDISRKTMGGWMAQCAELLDPLYQLSSGSRLGKVLDTLPFRVANDGVGLLQLRRAIPVSAAMCS
jgi:transposase